MNIGGRQASTRTSARAVIRDVDPSWSRRDLMRLAWHEVPGKTPQQGPSRRDGFIELFTRGFSTRLTFKRIKKSRRTPSHRPYGTGVFRDRSQAINCLATLIQSLRDKDRLPPNKTKLLTPPLHHSTTPRGSLSPFTSHFSLLTPRPLCETIG
jgi:hypothetical protein